MSISDRNFALDADQQDASGRRLQVHVRADTFEEFRDRLAEAGALFPQLLTRSQTAAPPVPATNAAGDPPCPVHRRPMKPSKFNGKGWYCTQKNRDGEYCQQTVSA